METVQSQCRRTQQSPAALLGVLKPSLRMLQAANCATHWTAACLRAPAAPPCRTSCWKRGGVGLIRRSLYSTRPASCSPGSTPGPLKHASLRRCGR